MADEDAGKPRSELELPHVDFGAHLIDHLFEVGPSTGGEAVTFQEIAAWSEQVGVTLNAWEAQTLRALSAAYLAELYAAEDESRPPPYRELNAKTRAQVSDAIKAAFERLAAQHEKKARRGKTSARRRA